MREIYELNERFYQLYCRLDRYEPKMSKRQKDAISSRLLKQYEIEFKMLELNNSI